MKRTIGAVLITAAASLPCQSATSADLDRTTPIEITAHQIVLDPSKPDRKLVNGLIYRGGLELSSGHKFFGGYSGLTVSPDGSKMIAISDRGTWLKADLIHENGRLSGIANAGVAPILGANGKRLGVGYRDAEALATDPRGGFLISFEGQHRLNHYSVAPLPVGSMPALLATPDGLSSAPLNKGLEAIVPLGARRYLLLTEDHRNDDLDTIGWILTHSHDRKSGSAAEISLAVSGLFHPTDAALLPDGDILVLERRYMVLKGGSMRLRRINSADVMPGTRLVGTTLGTITPPLTVDNMEGLAIRTDSDGKTLVYIMSDDNFKPGFGSLFLPSQRTLLMMFELAVPKPVQR